jgi:hypothetical protein
LLLWRAAVARVGREVRLEEDRLHQNEAGREGMLDGHQPDPLSPCRCRRREALIIRPISLLLAAPTEARRLRLSRRSSSWTWTLHVDAISRIVRG